jgi:hypothetical protein
MLQAARFAEAPLALKPELRHPDLSVGVPPGVVPSLIADVHPAHRTV